MSTGPSRNAKTALGFLAGTFVVGLYDTASNGNVSPHSPAFFKNNQVLLYGWLSPIIMLAITFAVVYTLKGSRRGYLGVALSGVMVILWQIAPLTTHWRFEGWTHTGTCWVTGVLAVITIRHAWAAYRESHAAEAKPADREAIRV
ncbi:MAG: hypothetical protein ACRDNF_15840 [Streptosporangiaceae bacterium]